MVIGFVGGSLRSHSCLVLSRSFGNQGVHSGVAKWDFKAQGGQVSRVLIRGLNADITSASQLGGHNCHNWDSVQYIDNATKWKMEREKERGRDHEKGRHKERT